MRVLIADDEEHVREGIELAIDWEKFGVSERLQADNGEQAMELIRRYQPAVLFCDMSMPGVDGMELMRRLREEGSDIQIIVVSGYDDFIYTKAAIQANGVDYILKPFRKRDLEEALERAISAWRRKEDSLRDERETEHRLRRADALLDEQKLALYFKGEVTFHNGIRSLLYKVGIAVDHIRASLIVPQNRIELVDRRFFGDGELFWFAVNNIAHETLKPYGAHYLCRLDDYQWLLLTAAERDRSASEYRRYIQRMTNAWKTTLGLGVLAGLSETEARAETLPASILEARASLLKSELLHGTASAPSQELPRFSQAAVLLQAALKNKDKVYAADIIRSFTHSIRERGSLRLKDLQLFTIEANLMLERTSRLHHTQADSTDLLMPLWICDLDEWEKELTQLWWALMEEEGAEGPAGRGIKAIYEYIQGHFQEDISLSTLSGLFHFSPQYIAKKFKELYNTTVMKFLIDLRMEKAKSLLVHTDLPVTELASALGYTDENYFSKVFKKQYGSSPLQFRKQSRDS